MTAYSYAPALTHEWLAVAAAGRLLVAKVDPASDRVGMLAATGSTETSVQQVLEVLTSQGLGATGPFALLFWVDGHLTDKGLGVIVRGEAAVTVDTVDGAITVSSRGVTTWTEQVLEGPTGFRVDLDPSAGSGPSDSSGLPLTSGAVWVSSVTLTDAGSDRSGTGAPASTGTPAGTGTGAGAGAGATSATPTAATVSTPGHGSPVAPAESQPAQARAEEPVPAQAEAAAAPEETRVFHTSTRSAPAQETDAAADAEAEGYDYLFGATVFRPVGAAAVEQHSDDDDSTPAMPEPAFLSAGKPASPAAPAAPAAQAPTSTLGDHDGRTMLASDIAAARQKKATQAGEPAAPASRPPSARYRLALPDGQSQALTAPVILGRAPSVSNVPASVLPHLVTLTGDDISRSHVRVSVEGDTVVVTDLHSSNGTHVIAPGKLPQLLRAGEPTPVITGTVIDLGSDIVLTVSEA